MQGVQKTASLHSDHGADRECTRKARSPAMAPDMWKQSVSCTRFKNRIKKPGVIKVT